MSDTLHLVDGHSLAYRFFYAMPSLSSLKGEPTQAVYGMARFLDKLSRAGGGDKVIVAFDPPGPTFRHKEFDKYKAHRKPTPPDLVSQFALIRKLVSLMGVASVEREGFEADDVIATLARLGAEAGMKVKIYSGDKDILQLVEPSVRVVVPKKGEDEEEIDREGVMEKWGVVPEGIPGLLALMGDSSDNLPGVEGVGPVKAAKLMKHFGSLEAMFSRLAEAESLGLRDKNLIERLEKAKEQVLKTRELAVLKKGLPIEGGLEGVLKTARDETGLRDFFEEMGFKSMLKDRAAPVAASSGPVPRRIEDAAEAVAGMEKAGVPVLMHPFSLGERRFLAVSFGGERIFTEISPGSVMALSRPLASLKVRKVLHGAKEFVREMLSFGAEVSGVDFDTRLAAYLLRSRSGKFSLAETAGEFGKGWPDAEPESEAAAARACLDALEDLYPKLTERIAADGLEELLKNVELPVSPVLARMESRGIKLDKERLLTVERDIESRLKDLEKEIGAKAGGGVNLLSPKQVAELLFKKLNLPARRKTKTGFSTDESVLEELSSMHPVPGMVLEYRRLAKLLGTYLKPLPDFCRDDGLLHTTYNQTGTATGRLSSSDPNLQNIPIKGEIGQKIRHAFIPRSKGVRLLSADYSQIELRIMAHMTLDEAFLESFRKGEDVHAATAAEMFGRKRGEVKPDERRAAKAVNFGIIYGMTAFGLSRELKCDPKTAQDYLDRYFSRHQAVKKFWDTILKSASETGYVSTLFGRRRYPAELNSPNRVRREEAQREALNHPIQGTAADIVKLAMIRVENDVPEARLILQIHDELLFEVPAGREEKLATRVAEVMEGVAELSVPLKVETAWGDSWAECHE